MEIFGISAVAIYWSIAALSSIFSGMAGALFGCIINEEDDDPIVLGAIIGGGAGAVLSVVWPVLWPVLLVYLAYIAYTYFRNK